MAAKKAKPAAKEVAAKKGKVYGDPIAEIQF